MCTYRLRTLYLQIVPWHIVYMHGPTRMNLTNLDSQCQSTELAYCVQDVNKITAWSLGQEIAKCSNKHLLFIILIDFGVTFVLP